MGSNRTKILSKSLFLKLVLLFIFLIIASYLILLLPLDQIISWTAEDGVCQSLGAIAFLLSFVLFLSSYLDSKGQGIQLGKMRSKRQPIFLLLALFFLVAFGEEISWGQRIFGWETTSSYREINTQDETNLHNLHLFSGRNPDGSFKKGFEVWLTAHRLFYGVVLTWALLIPLGYRLSSWFRKLINTITFPIQPIWMGALCLGVLVFGKFLKYLMHPPSHSLDHAISEISEANVAYVVAIIALYHFYHGRKLSPA